MNRLGHAQRHELCVGDPSRGVRLPVGQEIGGADHRREQQVEVELSSPANAAGAETKARSMPGVAPPGRLHCAARNSVRGDPAARSILSTMSQERSALRKLTNATRRAVRNPRWLRETALTKRRAHADRGREFSLANHAEHLCSVAEALGDAFSVSADEYRSLTARVRIPPAPDGSIWGGWRDILDLTGSLVLLRRPSVVIETGVAMGFTTAVILAAMDDNDAGALHSIDLPPLQVEAATFVGRVVPDELRGRWTLHAGPSRTLLPALARRLAPTDLFVHDSDHSYGAQYEEYRHVWPHLAVGGAIVSDDVLNSAFVEFAEEVGERPYLMAPPERDDAAVGLLVKTH